MQVDLKAFSHLLDIFNTSPDIYIYVKNTKSKFLYANHSFIEMLGATELNDLLGKDDRSFFEAQCAELYLAEDQSVFEGKEIINKKWEIPHAKEGNQWTLSSKKPLFDQKQKLIGHIGLIRTLPNSDSHQNSELEPVLRYIHQNLYSKFKISTLASLTHLSVSQFERKFKAQYKINPIQYILKIKLNRVAQALIESDRSVSEMSYDFGFCDYTHLSKHFKRLYHLTPKEYRQRYASR